MADDVSYVALLATEIDSGRRAVRPSPRRIDRRGACACWAVKGAGSGTARARQSRSGRGPRPRALRPRPLCSSPVPRRARRMPRPLPRPLAAAWPASRADVQPGSHGTRLSSHWPRRQALLSLLVLPTLEEIQGWGQSFDRLMRSAGEYRILIYMKQSYCERPITCIKSNKGWAGSIFNNNQT
ncbi:unnamed protein product [Leptidea sinapis]|uniref:Uncharacterized protein n=1 Tax=Leptidea sinapis TaxID=189913 RepID=A0A5E4QKW6_9NEOP|nr:unnamed protein product [Leptidea sinapis]